MISEKKKERIIELRNEGLSYIKIAKRLRLSRDQVRDFLRSKTAARQISGNPTKIRLD